NAMIVMDDADLDLALDGVLWGAFGTTGQRCTATSRLVVHERVHDELVKLLCDRAERLRLGPGLDANTDVGPLINEAARKKVEYGLSSSLYTRDVNAAFRAMGELDSGITYVNAPTIGAEAHLPFGGVKQTGNGHREGGWEVYDFYSETKVVYVDFSGKLQRAQIDTEA